MAYLPDFKPVTLAQLAKENKGSVSHWMKEYSKAKHESDKQIKKKPIRFGNL